MAEKVRVTSKWNWINPKVLGKKGLSGVLDGLVTVG